MRVKDSAFTHGIAEADILHAYTNAVRLVEIEQYGEDRLIVIGPDRAGNWLSCGHARRRRRPNHPRRPAPPDVLRVPEVR